MKGLFTDGDDRPLFTFIGTNEEILEWIEANKKQLPLNEWWSCDVTLEGDMVRISGDEDYKELAIKDVEVIKVGETTEERRLERIRNLMTNMYNLPQFIVESDGSPEMEKLIKNTAEKAMGSMPYLDKALDLNTTLEELYQLYENPENRGKPKRV